MDLLKEIMQAPGSVWNKSTIKNLVNQAEMQKTHQRVKSGVRNNEVPLKDPNYSYYINDRGDLRYEEEEGVDIDLDTDVDSEQNFDDSEFADVTPEEIDDMYGDEEVDGDEWAEELDDEDQIDDPDYQGFIRTVPNAHLVFKRQQPDGTFNELWIYNIGNDFRKELEIRKGILAGTDIPLNKMKSPDGGQMYELWTAGNAQLMHITGIPS